MADMIISDITRRDLIKILDQFILWRKESKIIGRVVKTTFDRADDIKWCLENEKEVKS
jgi:hypothetical protein